MASTEHQERRAGGPLLARAERELAAGRPWRARAHLHTLLQRDPGHAEARALLIDTLLAMGDQLGAGRALLRSERSDPQAAAAWEAWLADHRLGSDQADDPWRASLVVLDAAGLIIPGEHALDEAAVACLGPVARARVGALRKRIATAPQERGPLADAAEIGCVALGVLAFALLVLIPLALFVTGLIRLLGWIL